MLACLKHDYQISELISFFFANESFDIVMRVVHIAEVLEDSEHNLESIPAILNVCMKLLKLSCT